MVRVFVNHNVVTVPEPVTAIGSIVVRNSEKEPAKPEAAGPATFKPKDMAMPKASGEVSVRPWVIKVEVLIMAT